MARHLYAIDLCCGAGGWAFAARGLPIEFLCAVDRWDACCLTYARNHPGTEVLQRDVTHPSVLDWARGLPRIDLVVGGIPCEWLSVRRNVQRGATDAEKAEGRATLDAMLGIVRAVRPRWWCLENVVQVRGELPPLTPHQVLEAAGYGGQRRKRCFVGVFPRPKRAASAAVMRDYLRPGPYRIGRRVLGRELRTSKSFSADACYAADPARKSPTVCATSSRRDTETVVMDRPGGRQLEWQEAAALQGFPDDAVFIGSPSDCWKMIGQAVQIGVGRAVLEGIAAAWKRETGREKGTLISADLL